jgi:tetratricopeptide (TPR) repeat protein
MKKQIIVAALSIFSLAAFAQKDELKVADKAFKKGNFEEVLTTLKPLEASESNMDAKYKGKYLFLKGQSLEKTGEIKKAAKAYRKLFAFEKETGKKKYTPLARPMLEGVVTKVKNEATDAYNSKKDYKQAAEKFALVYAISPKDTAFLYNSAISAYLDKDYDTALKHYRKLKDLKYTGITKQYYAVNKETGTTDLFGSETDRDAFVKLQQYENPTEKILPSKRSDIIKNIGYILVTQGKTEEAIKALEEARKENPEDVNLVMTEAQLYIDLKRMDKFEELMKEAVKLDPNNPALFYNLGVVNGNAEKYNEAIEYYKKAVELKSDYRDAYLNLSFAILNKRVAIINEMNENLSNAKKYDALEQKMKDLNKEALPYLEKADSLERSLETVKNLLNIYDSLEMVDKADALRPIYKEMKNK